MNDARKVAVVNQTFVRCGNALIRSGSAFAWPELESFPCSGEEDPWFEIVGVVADVKNRGLFNSRLKRRCNESFPAPVGPLV